MENTELLAHAPAEAWLPAMAARLAQGQAQVLVTVVHTQGSTPRDTGARMWVGADFIMDTIGGGHLEWKAIASARQMLGQAAPQCRITRYPLGPALGQCCGGVVWLLFEHLVREDAAWCARIASRLAQGGSVVRRVTMSPLAAGATTRAAGSSRDPLLKFVGDMPRTPTDVALDLADDAVPATQTSLDCDSATLIDLWSAPDVHVVVCGAGHIGCAIVRLLAELPVQVIWLDPRDDCWPSRLPANVRTVEGGADDVPDMPDNAYWLVLTHNHALDLAIIDAVFRQKPFAFLGLIGSKSKRARFAAQLSRRHQSGLVERMCCPIGIVQTSSKRPSVIAVSVVAQLLGLMAA